MKIRLATNKDITGIIYVQATTWIIQYPNPSLGISEDDIRSIDWKSKEPEWQHMIKSSDYSVWVAAEQNNILGFTVLTKTRGKHELYALYVLPEHQGMGIGTKLMDKVLGLVDGDLFLQVATYNDSARRFYSERGFKSTGALGVYNLPNGKAIPTLNMRKVANEAELPAAVTRKQLAALAGVRESTIKWYTEQGLLSFKQDDKRRRRYYELDETLRRLRHISDRQSQGLSLQEIKDKF